MAIINCHLAISLHCWLKFAQVLGNKVGRTATWVGVGNSVQGEADPWPETHLHLGFWCGSPQDQEHLPWGQEVPSTGFQRAQPLSARRADPEYKRQPSAPEL